MGKRPSDINIPEMHAYLELGIELERDVFGGNLTFCHGCNKSFPHDDPKLNHLLQFPIAFCEECDRKRLTQKAKAICNFCGELVSRKRLHRGRHFVGLASWIHICDPCIAKLNGGDSKMADAKQPAKVVVEAFHDKVTSNFNRFQIEDNAFGIRGSILISKRKPVPPRIEVALHGGSEK